MVERVRLRTDTNRSQWSTNCIRFLPTLTLATTSNFSPLGTASRANGSPVSATWTDRMVASQVPDIGSS